MVKKRKVQKRGRTKMKQSSVTLKAKSSHHYPLFRRQDGVIKLRVPGPGPVNKFNKERSKKEVISKRAVIESNKDASLLLQTQSHG